MKTSLKSPQSEVVDVDSTVPVDDLHDNQEASRALAPIRPGGGFGELSRDDYETPYLQITQKTSDAAQIHGAGAILLNDTKIGDEKSALNLIVLDAHKSYIENLDYGSEEPPRVFATLEEVRKAGGTLQWIGDVKPSFVPQANLIVAIEGQDDITFEYPVGDKRYALAAWRLRKQAYEWAAKTVWTVARAVQGDLASVQFTLKIQQATTRKGKTWVPTLSRTGKVNDETKKALLSLIS